MEDEVHPAPGIVAADRRERQGLRRSQQARTSRASGARRWLRPTSSSTALDGVRCSDRNRRRRSRRPTASGRSGAPPGCSRMASSCQSATWPMCSASDQSGPPASDGAAPGRCQAASSRPAHVAERIDPTWPLRPPRSRGPRPAGRGRGHRRGARGAGRPQAVAASGVIGPWGLPCREPRGWLRAGRRAPRSDGTRPRPPPTARSAGARSRVRAVPRPTCRRGS